MRIFSLIAVVLLVSSLAAPARAGSILSGYTYVIDGDTIDVGGPSGLELPTLARPSTCPVLALTAGLLKAIRVLTLAAANFWINLIPAEGKYFR